MVFKTKELIFIALMAALLFVLNLIIGAGLIAATGIPGASGFVTGITNMMAVTFLALVLRKFGPVSMMYLIYAILALPTHMAGGPPGFFWKIPVLVVSALLLEVILWRTHYRKIGFIIGLPVLIIGGFALYVFAYWALGMPELGKLLPALPYIGVSLILLGYLGMWLGFILYNKLKNKRIMKQITA